MNIVFFTHPSFFNSRSMAQYAQLLSEGMAGRRHQVQVISPKAFFSSLPFPKKSRKWLGYIDQYLVFPLKIKKKIKKFPPNTLFVFTDQALGIWIPLVAKRPHVIHCHDFLALRSALNEYYENPVSWTGKIYQQWIRNGFSKGENFISISQRTREDLHKFHLKEPVVSKVVYNQISSYFKPENNIDALANLKRFLSNIDLATLEGGYILHVGANVWYKNKGGVLEIYHAWRHKYKQTIPLVMVGEPDEALNNWITNKLYKRDIIFFQNISEELLVSVYNKASVLLFPSLAEGFGWPIAEAMACRCAVITTDEAPMTEVGGKAAFYLPKSPHNNIAIAKWAELGADLLQNVLSKNTKDMEKILDAGIVQAEKFKYSDFLDHTENIYRQVLNKRNI